MQGTIKCMHWMDVTHAVHCFVEFLQYHPPHFVP